MRGSVAAFGHVILDSRIRFLPETLGKAGSLPNNYVHTNTYRTQPPSIHNVLKLNILLSLSNTL